MDVAAPPAVPHPERPDGLLGRIPAFCAGCPHGTSTRLPDGSFATAGIGCHFMALDHGDATRTFTHMGGEGVTWVGLQPFTDMPHVFANIGRRHLHAFRHSGDPPGGRGQGAHYLQDPVQRRRGDDRRPTRGGRLHRAANRRAGAAEGVRRIAIVADEADRLPPPSALPPGTTRHVRGELDAVQRDLRDY